MTRSRHRPVAPARAAALAALREVSEGRCNLGAALARAKASLSDDRDRALAGEIVTGTLRFRLAIDEQLARVLTRPLAKLDAVVLDVLRIAAFQLLHLTRVPARAVINDAVSAVRGAKKTSATGLVNAALRRLAETPDQREPLQRPDMSRADDPAVARWLGTVYSHPGWLVERWVGRYGPVSTEAWLTYNNRPQPPTLAVNTARAARDQVQEALSAEGVDTVATRFAPAGLSVRAGRLHRSIPFRSGACVIQDEASQLVAELVGVEEGHWVLDACAAPGGKTMALAAGVGPRGGVVACDVRTRRMTLLQDTLARTTVPRVWAVHVPIEGPLPFRDCAFDRVLIDAPCSGLGTIRRDPDIKWTRRPDDLEVLAAAQRRLLDRAARLVRPAGRLVYSTCSSEPEENEEVVARFLESHPEFRVWRLHTGSAASSSVDRFVTEQGYWRTFPHRDGLDAFFGAVLERRVVTGPEEARGDSETEGL